MKAWPVLLLITLVACKKSGGGSNTPVTDAQITISDITFFEGNSGHTSFEFIVSLNKAATKEVSLTWNTVAGTAKAGEDFVAAASQVLTIPVGSTQQKLFVAVVADDLREGNDTFTVQLQNVVNASLQKQTATATIRNDDTKVPFNNTGYDAPGPYAGYTLAWADEFNNGSLDMNTWSFQNGDGCPNVCGWGNEELEYYRPDNLSFQDGKMIIEARPESYGSRNYTSSKIISEGKKSFKYGRVDIRAILPKGKGLWPAFWMLPQNNVFGAWPKSGEIDITELVGHEPNKTVGTVHFGPGPASTYITNTYTLPSQTFNDAFHVFSLEWKPDQVKWLLDGNLFATVNKADLGSNNYPFNENFFFIINLAVGGRWPGSPDASTYFPQWLIVDYIRVYQ